MAHEQRSHALLSASGSHRWLNCTPSAKLEERFADTTSEAAKEGTLAHELAEQKLIRYFRADKVPKRQTTTRINALKKILCINLKWTVIRTGTLSILRVRH